MPELFLLDEVAHDQACNFIKKRFQRRCFTVDFAKFLKAPSRTPPVNAFAVRTTFLILRPRRLQLKMLLVKIIFEWKVTMNQKTKTTPYFWYFC